MAQIVLIVGASVRAAAFSTIRAGLEPRCIDLFADADLTSVCEYRRVASFDEVPAAAAQFGPGPWMYTGAIENRPWLIAQLARERPLWGNDAAVVERVRSPKLVAEVLGAAGIPFPETRLTADRMPTNGDWLVKPVASAGGRGIEWWRGQPLRSGRQIVFQRYIEGPSYSACYVAADGNAVLLGVTKQLVGETWLHAAPFHYCGSIGPQVLDHRHEEAFTRIGIVLAQACGLRGLFGVDCVMHDGVPWPIEVNPRYTASLEVIELATGLKALEWHERVFEDRALTAFPMNGIRDFIGKVVFFASRVMAFPAGGPWEESAAHGPTLLRRYADIPKAEEILPAGAPVITVFAKGSSPQRCFNELKDLAADLDRHFTGQ